MPDDAIRFVDVFLSGLLLGIARERMGSCLVTMPPHVLGNMLVVVLLRTT